MTNDNPTQNMNWTAVQALVHTFAIAHNAYVVFDSCDRDILVYEPDRVIFHPAKLIISPCAETHAACVRSSGRHFPSAASIEQLGKYVAAAYAILLPYDD